MKFESKIFRHLKRKHTLSFSNLKHLVSSENNGTNQLQDIVDHPLFHFGPQNLIEDIRHLALNNFPYYLLVSLTLFIASENKICFNYQVFLVAKELSLRSKILTNI